MTTRKRVTAPAHLSAESQALYRSVLADYELEDRHTKTLTVALEALDRMRQAQEAVAKDGAYIPDRWGGLKAHPALAVERDSRTAYLRAQRELGLDLPAEMLKVAADDIRDALHTLQERRALVGRDDPAGRDVSIAITHLEDALLRITVGTPS